MKRINNKGFTLIELLAVIVILAIITVLATRNVLVYMTNANKETFISETNMAISGAYDAMHLIEIGSVNDNYSKSVNNDGSTIYCFTLTNLNEIGTFEKNDNNYEGRIIITVPTNSNDYTYSVNMHNLNYYVMSNKKTIKEITGNYDNTNTNVIYDCSNYTNDTSSNLVSNILNNAKNSDLWDSPLEGDGYRYVGTNPSNYICFGTRDKDTCINDTDKYMYRIIGVFEDKSGNKHVKLIKKEALNTLYIWDGNWNLDVDWNQSALYKGLNGSYFLNNTSYPYMQDSTWTDKIATWNYTMTNTKTYEDNLSITVSGPHYHYNVGKTIYLHELNKNGKTNETCYYYNSSRTADCNIGIWKTLNTKISLMYVSDFALSLGSESINTACSSSADLFKTSWLNIVSDNEIREWTMTHNSYNVYDHSVWGIISNIYNLGIVGNYGIVPLRVDVKGVVRPVFYLEPDVEITVGNGTIAEPFLIK